MTDLEHELDLDAERRRTNSLAIIALFSALVGLFPPAIVFGVIAMVKLHRNYEAEDGYWMAFWGVALGLLPLIIGIITLAVVVAG